jgi:hypothetical protein
MTLDKPNLHLGRMKARLLVFRILKRCTLPQPLLLPALMMLRRLLMLLPLPGLLLHGIPSATTSSSHVLVPVIPLSEPR